MILPACVGLGWRPETAWLIDRRPRIAFSEAIAENIDPRRPPPALAAAIDRGLPVVTHGVALSLGGAEPLDRARLRRLAAVARALRSPLVSEHIAFARAGGTEGDQLRHDEIGGETLADAPGIEAQTVRERHRSSVGPEVDADLAVQVGSRQRPERGTVDGGERLPVSEGLDGVELERIEGAVGHERGIARDA